MKDLDKFFKLLINLKEELMESQSSTADDIKPVVLDQTAFGRVSRGEAMQVQQMALESARRRELRLVAIEEALKRLAKQEYGICLECDEDINIRRLEIEPTATHCIKCAELIFT
jgi:DnaK suppressor protein